MLLHLRTVRKPVDIARDHVNFNEEVQNEHEGNSTYGENNEKWLDEFQSNPISDVWFQEQNPEFLQSKLAL